MINWNDVRDLHVTKKLIEILNKWFNVEVIFSDNNHKIRSHHLERDYEFVNYFLNVQMGQKFGTEYLNQDIEKIGEQLNHAKEGLMEYDSFYPHVKGLAAKIVVDGEFLGTVFAYPFIKDSITSEEVQEIISKMIEYGASEKDAKSAVGHLKRMRTTEGDHCREITSLVAEEIATFHEEITKREDRIHELNSELGDKYRYHSMIGKSKKMQQI